MSFFENPNITSFLSNINTPQKVYPKNISVLDKNSELKNLFTSINNNNKKANIFSANNKKNQGIFSFLNNQSDNKIKNGNISDRIIFGDSNNDKDQIIFGNNIYKKYNEYTLGTIFNGRDIKCNKQNYKLMSITSLPEYNYASNEELRLADIEKNKTGNISFFKIKNTSKSNNLFGGNNNLNINNKLFLENYRNNLNDKNSQIYGLNKNNNIQENKKEDTIFSFNSNNKNSKLYNSNKIINNQNNSIQLGRINNYSSPFGYLMNSNNINSNNINNSNNIQLSYSPNYSLNNNKNIFSKNEEQFTGNDKNLFLNINNNNNELLKYEKVLNPIKDIDMDMDIYKLLSKNEKLSNIINEAIKKGQTVKEFMEELKEKYINRENIKENIYNTNQNNSNFLDLYGNYMINNDNKYENGISYIQNNNNKDDNLKNLYQLNLGNSINEVEVPCYKMEVEYDDIFNNLNSKINKIYNEYEKNKNNFNYKKSYTNLSKFQNYTLNEKKLNSKKNMNKNLNEDDFFNKTFSNGLPNYDSLLNDSNSILNKSYIHKKRKNIMIGRDEDLYQKNLLELNKLSLCEITTNSNSENKPENEKNQILYINNNETHKNNIDNILNKSVSNSFENDSPSTISKQMVDLTIQYHLPDDEQFKKNKNIKFYNIYLRNIDQLIKIETLKEEIKSKIYTELKNKNYQNYSIQKISLLIPFGFLYDNDILLDYNLCLFDNVIQSFITYKRNNSNNNEIINHKDLAPFDLVPKLYKSGYKCIPNLVELSRKTCDELKNIHNFKIFNEYGEVEFKEPINLLGVNLDDQITIENNLIDTGNKLNYWSIFKLYNFKLEENEIENYKNNIKKNGGQFISYKNNELTWEYIPNYVNDI